MSDLAPPQFLQTSTDDNWKPCPFCKSELVQLRKAFFQCTFCKQTFIADEEDMRR